VNEELISTAKRINWYTAPGLLLDDKSRFLCEIMARGTVEDVVIAKQTFNLEEFREAYKTAPPGLFDKKSWGY